jgi:hypothetical protein
MNRLATAGVMVGLAAVGVGCSSEHAAPEHKQIERSLENWGVSEHLDVGKTVEPTFMTGAPQAQITVGRCVGLVVSIGESSGDWRPIDATAHPYATLEEFMNAQGC